MISWAWGQRGNEGHSGCCATELRWDWGGGWDWVSWRKQGSWVSRRCWGWDKAAARRGRSVESTGDRQDEGRS